MPQKIWKYPIDTTIDEITIEMPEGARILSFKVQRGIPTLWALINLDNKFEKRHFRIIGTGQSIEEDNLKYIDSIQLAGEKYIFHLFETSPTE